MHRITRRLGDASARRPRTVVAAWMSALAVVLVLAGSAGATFTDDFVAAGSSSAQAQQLLEERFPDLVDGTALAVFAAPEGDRLEMHRAAVAAALAAVTDVETVVTAVDPFTGGAVSADGRIGYATLAFDRPSGQLPAGTVAAVAEALSPARDGGIVAELGGEAAFVNAETQSSGAELVGVLVALVVLVVAFGALAAAIVPVLLALVAVGIGLGLVVLLSATASVSTAAPMIGAMVGLGVGIDYALVVVARYRENRATGQDDRSALSDATATAGSAVAFAGVTVVVAMSALLLTGLGFLTSIGLAASLVVLVALAAALTLLPALLALLGDRIDAGRLRRRRRPSAPAQGDPWWRFAHRVARHPWAWLLIGTSLLLALAAPALDMRTGFPDAGDEATSMTNRRAYDLLADGFGPGVNGPLLVVADLRDDGADAGDLAALGRRLAADRGIASVDEPITSPAGDAVVLPVLPTTAATDPATSQTLERVRALLPANVAVTGLTALTDDLTAQLSEKLPVFLGAILAASFLLLMLVFRSVVVPLKAAVMNLLSIGGAYGVVVVLFQWGWLQGLTGLDQTVAVVSPLPALFFAVLFGLSMDYEVFLLSRIREEHQATGDDVEAVARGLAATGRVITSAALIMTAVFVSFAANPSPLARMVGVGLATAIVLDATVVRMVLVPASMALLGRANWWLPRWLDRLLPPLSVEAPVVPPQRQPAPAALPSARGGSPAG